MEYWGLEASARKSALDGGSKIRNLAQVPLLVFGGSSGRPKFFLYKETRRMETHNNVVQQHEATANKLEKQMAIELWTLNIAKLRSNVFQSEIPGSHDC